MRLRALVLTLLLVACGGGGPPAAPPRPADTTAVETPRVIPDPVAVMPERDLRVEPVDSATRARELVAVGQALRHDPLQMRTAVERFRAAISFDSSYAVAHWELGWTLQLLGQWNDALAAWTQLRTIEPDYPGLSRYEPVIEMRRDRAAAVAELSPGLDIVPPEEEPRRGDRIRIAAVGDITLGSAWPDDRVELPPDGPQVIFGQIAPLLGDADITFGNLETALADSGASRKCRPTSTSCYAFRVPTEYAGAIRRAGFTVVSVNNNHAGDFGEAGRAATARALDSTGVYHSGPFTGIASWETKGVRIALLAFSTGEGPFRVQDIATARRFVIDADDAHDLVLVSFHGGAEGSDATHVPKASEEAYGEDRGDVYAFARAMIDAGADLVLGHGPHVLRGMEVYRGRLIAYSLGNFSAWENFNLRGPLGVTGVLYVTMAPNGVATAAELASVIIVDPGIPTPDPLGRAVDAIRALSTEDFGDPLFDTNGRWVRPDRTPEGSLRP